MYLFCVDGLIINSECAYLPMAMFVSLNCDGDYVGIFFPFTFWKMYFFLSSPINRIINDLSYNKMFIEIFPLYRFLFVFWRKSKRLFHSQTVSSIQSEKLIMMLWNWHKNSNVNMETHTVEATIVRRKVLFHSLTRDLDMMKTTDLSMILKRYLYKSHALLTFKFLIVFDAERIVDFFLCHDR